MSKNKIRGNLRPEQNTIAYETCVTSVGILKFVFDAVCVGVIILYLFCFCQYVAQSTHKTAYVTYYYNKCICVKLGWWLVSFNKRESHLTFLFLCLLYVNLFCVVIVNLCVYVCLVSVKVLSRKRNANREMARVKHNIVEKD